MAGAEQKVPARQESGAKLVRLFNITLFLLWQTGQVANLLPVSGCLKICFAAVVASKPSAHLLR
jgi:hypothetical protein